MATLESTSIGFPPPLLGEEPTKLSAQLSKNQWIAVEKPAGIEIRPDSKVTNRAIHNLENALQAQAKRSLPSLTSHGFSPDYNPKSIYQIDRDIYGFGLWALNDDSLEELRNEFGSNKFNFHFEFFAQDEPNSGEEFSVYLPIAQHLQDPDRCVISTQTGKKAETEFSKIKVWPKANVALWQAATPMPRGHQIRLHAFECGINILGETIYTQTPEIALTDLKKKRVSKRESASKPIWSGLNMCLSSLSGDIFPEGKITFAHPRAMDTLIRKLDQFAT